MLDMTESIAPKSDQQNFDDYLSGPRTVTISEARAGSAEQPIELHLSEYPGRPYKPSKSMRRVLVAGWGRDASGYVGRRMTLYGDPAVKFGGAVMGGIKISHLSHIYEPLNLSLTATKGKRAPHNVQPLPDSPAPAAKTAGITEAQSKQLVAAMAKVGLSAKEAALEFLSDRLGREVTTSKDLTKDEASHVIEALEQTIAEPTLDGGDTSWPTTAQPADAQP